MSNSFTGAVLREPLLHFSVLALGIFAIDAIVGPDEDGERIIRIDQGVESRLIEMFVEGQGREPGADELEALTERWLQNEVMYREARVLGLDRGDDMIRERLITKMRTVLGNSVVVDTPEDATLIAYFTQNQARYRQPERYDFAQFFVADENERDRVEALADSLEVSEVPDAYSNRLRRYKTRTRDNMVAMFGESFVDELLQDAGARWHLLPSERGWHLARLDRVHASIEPDFETLRNRVEDDWRETREREQLVIGFQELRNKYSILVDAVEVESTASDEDT